MKLNKKDRERFRKIVFEKLKDIDFDPNKRIKLPDEDLEDLLFEKMDDGKHKKIAYFYEGLCKLDLSKVSFANVSLDSPWYVDLGDTNVNINFCRDFFRDDLILARNINFTNVNLENSEGSSVPGLKKMINCNLTNTGFNVISTRFEYHECNLTGLDLSSAKIYYEIDIDGNNSLVLSNNEKYHAIINYHPHFYQCKLTNTRARVYSHNEYRDDDQDWIAANKYLSVLIHKGELDGCYVNDVLIKSPEEKRKDSEKLFDKYIEYSSGRINSVLDLIDDQLNHPGGRQLKLKKNTKKNKGE